MGSGEVAVLEAVAHRLALGLALAREATHQLLHVRERRSVFLLQFQCQSVVQHRLGQAPALLVVEGALLVVPDQLAELLFDLVDAAPSPFVLEGVAVDAAPDREGRERVAVLVAALAEFERSRAGGQARAEQRQREAPQAGRTAGALAGACSGTSTE